MAGSLTSRNKKTERKILKEAAFLEGTSAFTRSHKDAPSCNVTPSAKLTGVQCCRANAPSKRAWQARHLLPSRLRQKGFAALLFSPEGGSVGCGGPLATHWPPPAGSSNQPVASLPSPPQPALGERYPVSHLLPSKSGLSLFSLSSPLPTHPGANFLR